MTATQPSTPTLRGPVPSSAPFANKLAPPSLMRALASPRNPQSSIVNHQSSMTAPRQLDLYIEKPHPLLSVSDLALEWSYSEQHIIDLITEGKLFALFVNEDDAPLHRHYRIVRHTAIQGQSLTVAGMNEVVAGVDAWLFPVERWGRRQVFTTLHAAEIIAVSPRHIRKLYDAGQVNARNLGLGQKELSLRIPRAQLTAFVQKRLRLANGITA